MQNLTPGFKIYSYFSNLHLTVNLCRILSSLYHNFINQYATFINCNVEGRTPSRDRPPVHPISELRALSELQRRNAGMGYRIRDVTVPLLWCNGIENDSSQVQRIARPVLQPGPAPTATFRAGLSRRSFPLPRRR